MAVARTWPCADASWYSSRARSSSFSTAPAPVVVAERALRVGVRARDARLQLVGLHAPARRRGLPRGATSAWVCTTAGLLARQVRRPPRALRPAPREKTEGARVSSCEPRGSLSRSPKAKVGPAGRAGRPGARSATEHARTWLRRARCPQSRERGRAGRAGRGRSLEHSRTSSSVRVVARVAWVARERGRDSPPIARPEGLSGKTADRPCAGNSRPIRARSSYGEAGLACCGSSTPVRPPPLGVAGAIRATAQLTRCVL